jgi:hypothetical protein
MTTKAPKRGIVEFYATSSRLARAIRHAAKHNKSVARFAAIEELGHAVAAHDRGECAHEFQMVGLSNADDDHLALIDSRAEPVVSAAFHVLFTGPGTHPDQVAQWMTSTNIRSENRLHVVEVDEMEAPQVSQLLGLVCFALGEGSSECAAAVRVGGIGTNPRMCQHLGVVSLGAQFAALTSVANR